jgi:TNF receptor-associated protein 1
MITTEKSETHQFQAEVQQVLDIVMHSLYTEKEIFIRELISNSSDSLEKLRHLQLVEKEIFDEDLKLEINISTDQTANTITIQDFGVGMTRKELNKNLGTIAYSGTKNFLKAVKKNNQPDKSLIGQFGVGFYSAFMVAKEVKLYTHFWHKEGEHLFWKSQGANNYEIQTTQGQRRGCKIIITLTEDAKEFSNPNRVKAILQHYSSFVNFPINLNGERINKINALWLRNKTEIKKEEYTEFYKFQANAFDEPMAHLHFSADVPLAINALLFIPSHNPESFGFGRMEAGVSLYCKKILIEAKPEGLLPDWLRFLKGVVDSADLPLNISRETMQDSALIHKFNKILTKRFLKMLEEQAKKNTETFEKIYNTFAPFIKEGIVTDADYRPQLGNLLRYESTFTESGKTTSLADYISRAKDQQKQIYYLFAPERERKHTEKNPYLEAFKARSLEVLFLYDPIDEFVMAHLAEFEGKKLIAADNAEIEFDKITPASTEKTKPLSPEKTNTLCTWIKQTLGKQVERVDAGKRLIDSPAIILNTEKMMSPRIRRLINATQQQEKGLFKINLEINPHHPLIKNLATFKEKDPRTAKLIAEQILDNAMVTAGYSDNSRSMVTRVYELLEYITTKDTVNSQPD